LGRTPFIGVDKNTGTPYWNRASTSRRDRRGLGDTLKGTGRKKSASSFIDAHDSRATEVGKRNVSVKGHPRRKTKKSETKV